MKKCQLRFFCCNLASSCNYISECFKSICEKRAYLKDKKSKLENFQNRYWSRDNNSFNLLIY